MLRFGIFVPMLLSLLTCSFGFTMDRSVVFVPSAWDTAPSLDTYHRVFVDPVLKNKMQAGIDKILQTKDAKLLENQTSEEKSTTGNIEIEMKLMEIKPINEIASATRNDASDSSEESANAIITPRNVILLLIDERGQDEKKEENSWKDYKERLPFAIEGFLQSCRDKIEKANFSLDNASISEKKEKNCDCEHALRSNIGELLFWARQAKGMTIGIVSGSNFSIPFLPIYEASKSNESNAKLELRKNKRDSNDNWQMIDLSNRTSSVSPLITTDSKTGGDMNDDVTWDILDVFSKIRMAFFRSLLESLHRNSDTFRNQLSLRKPLSFEPTVTSLIKNTIRELKSIPTNKGYMLIAAVSKSEGAAAVELLQHEVSPKDTLLIVTQICVGDQRSVPFAAQGPNCQILREAKIIDELPITIKKAMITNDCHDTECANRQRRDVPIVSRVPIDGIFSQELPAQKQIIRNKNVEQSKIVTIEETTIRKEIQARNSDSLKTIPCGFAAVLGITISILTKVAMTFS